MKKKLRKRVEEPKKRNTQHSWISRTTVPSSAPAVSFTSNNVEPLGKRGGGVENEGKQYVPLVVALYTIEW